MDRSAAAQADTDRQDKIADRHRPKIEAAIRDAMQAVAEALPTGGRPDTPLDHFPRISQALGALYRDITREQASSMVDTFKSGFEWLESKAQEDGFYDRLFEEYMQRFGGSKIAQISETTRAQIVRIIERGLKNGLSLDEISGEIMTAAPIVAETRAHIIARTETHSASMYASLASAKRSTLPLNKEWVSVEDGRTRDFGAGDGEVDDFSHRVMDGKTVPMDDPYEVPSKFGFTEKLQFPGDPAGSPANIINCRCSQVYVPADAEGGDAEPTRTAPPVVGDERARILDRIRGEQPVFSQNQDDAFNAAPIPVLQAIAKAGDLRRMIRDRGAYADFNGGISMGPHTPGGADYKRVFRHEHGHFVDDQIAKQLGTKGGMFASWRAAKSLVDDGDELLAARSKTFMGDKAKAQDIAAKNGRGFMARVDELFDQYDDSDELLRATIPEVEPEDIWRLYGSTNREVESAARIAAAWERRDVGQAISELPTSLSGQRVSHSSPFAGLQDTFESSTGGNVRIHFGHGKNYYTRSNTQMTRRGLAANFGRRKFNGFNTAQAFANWFEAYGDPNPAAYALYKRLYPRVATDFEDLIEEFINASV